MMRKSVIVSERAFARYAHLSPTSVPLCALCAKKQEFPDKMVQASPFGSRYVVMGDFKASEWFERAYERRETYFFADLFLAGLIMPSFTSLEGLGYGKAFAAYRLTPGYEALAAKPLFGEWQVEHDRIAAALAAHKDPLSLP